MGLAAENDTQAGAACAWLLERCSQKLLLSFAAWCMLRWPSALLGLICLPIGEQSEGTLGVSPQGMEGRNGRGELNEGWRKAEPVRFDGVTLTSIPSASHQPMPSVPLFPRPRCHTRPHWT